MSKPPIPLPWQERWVAALNGVLGRVGLVIFGLTALLSVLLLIAMLVSGPAGGGGPWSGMGAAMLLGALIAALLLGAVGALFCFAQVLAARWLWRGDRRGRSLAVKLGWIACVGALYVLVRGSGTPDPWGWLLLGALLAIYAALDLLLLLPWHWGRIVAGCLAAAVVISGVMAALERGTLGNQGRIPFDLSSGNVALIPSGELLVVGHDNRTSTRMIEVLDFTSGNVKLRQPFPILGGVKSRDGKLMASMVGSPAAPFGGQYPSTDVLVCEVPTGQQRMKLKVIEEEGKYCEALQLSPRGDFLAVVSAPNRRAIWTVPEGRLLRSWQVLKGASEVSALDFDPAGTALAVATESSAGGATEIARWLILSEDPDPTWRFQAGRVLRMATSADGVRLMVLTPSEVLALDFATGKVLARHTLDVGEPAVISAAEFSSDGNTLVTIRVSGKVTIWNTQSGQLAREFSIGRKVDQGKATIDVDSMRLAGLPFTPGKAWIGRWDLATGAEVRSFEKQ